MGWKDKVSSKVWGKIISKKTADKPPFDLAKSELDILKAKEKMVKKLAKDVKDNPDLFKKGKAFKEGLGKFGFNKPSGKK